MRLGSASLEFIVAGLVLLVPVVYLVVVLFQIQSAVLAAEGGARQAARVFVQSPDARTGAERAATAVQLAFADQGVDGAGAAAEITCPDGGLEDCLDAGDLVTVVVADRDPAPARPTDPRTRRPGRHSHRGERRQRGVRLPRGEG